MPGQLGGAPLCVSCNTRVYFNELKAYMNQSWHKKCFRCESCNKALETGNANLHERALFCNNCARKRNQQATSAAKKPAAYVNVDDPECCRRCGKRVFFAEQILSLGRKWHKACFSCSSCNKKVDSTSAADHEGELYCRPCHGRRFGPKGYGFAGGAGTMLSMDDGGERTGSESGSQDGGSRKSSVSSGSGQTYVNHADAQCCPRCGKRVYFAEQILSLGRKWHKSCFCCCECGKKVDSNSAADHEGELYCRPCHGRRFGPKGYGFAGGAGTMLSMDPVKTTSGNDESLDEGQMRKPSLTKQGSRDEYVNCADPECCPRCGKRVYFAEQILNLSRKWHKSCFCCAACGKKVDSNSAADHEGELYCRPCHGRRFGPKGYGFAGGAGTMLSMDRGDDTVVVQNNAPLVEDDVLPPGGDGDTAASELIEQVNIGGAESPVFTTEQEVAGGDVYHDQCLSCALCNEKFDSHDLVQIDGDIYCQACYANEFAAEDFAYGNGTGILQTN